MKNKTGKEGEENRKKKKMREKEGKGTYWSLDLTQETLFQVNQAQMHVCMSSLGFFPILKDVKCNKYKEKEQNVSIINQPQNYSHRKHFIFAQLQIQL